MVNFKLEVVLFILIITHDLLNQTLKTIKKYYKRINITIFLTLKNNNKNTILTNDQIQCVLNENILQIIQNTLGVFFIYFRKLNGSEIEY